MALLFANEQPHKVPADGPLTEDIISQQSLGARVWFAKSPSAVRSLKTVAIELEVTTLDSGGAVYEALIPIENSTRDRRAVDGL
jgi:hypothetical protein